MGEFANYEMIQKELSKNEVQEEELWIYRLQEEMIIQQNANVGNLNMMVIMSLVTTDLEDISTNFKMQSENT